MHSSITEQHLLLLRSYEQTELRLLTRDWKTHRIDKPYMSFDLAARSSRTRRPAPSRFLLEGPIHRGWSICLLSPRSRPLKNRSALRSASSSLPRIRSGASSAAYSSTPQSLLLLALLVSRLRLVSHALICSICS